MTKNKIKSESLDIYIGAPIINTFMQQSLTDVKPHMLLVNDQYFLLYGYKMRLERLFEVELAENRLQALQIVLNKLVDYL